MNRLPAFLSSDKIPLEVTDWAYKDEPVTPTLTRSNGLTYRFKSARFHNRERTILKLTYRLKGH